MPRFSKRSLDNLATADPRLQKLFHEVIKHFDCVVIEGHRSIERQQELFHKGFSKIDGVTRKGKHNYSPSLAVDVIPYPVDWNDTNRMYYFGGFVKGIAEGMGLKIRWGGDWDSDTKVNDHRFIDLPHFEI